MSTIHDDSNDARSRDRSPVDLRAARQEADYGYSGSYIGPELTEGPGESFADHLGVLLTRKWTTLFWFVLVFSLSCVYTFTRTPIYESQATLEIGAEQKDTIKTIGETLGRGVGGFADRDLFATQGEILKSRSLAEALILRMKLYKDPRFLQQEDPGLLSKILDLIIPKSEGRGEGGPLDLAEEQKRNTLILNVQKRLSVSRVGESRLIRLEVTDEDPQFAQAMLQTYIDIYIDQNFRKRTKGTEEASQWLNEEMEKTEKALRRSMEDIVKFTSQNGIVSLEEGANHLIKFFDKAAEDLVKSKEQKLGLEAAIKSQNPGGVGLINADARRTDVEQMEEKLSRMESEYSEMAEIYSDSFPRLKLLAKQINYLRDKIAKKKDDLASAALESAKTQEEMRQEAFDEAKKKAMGVNKLGVQYAVLMKDKETNEQIYKILLQKTKEIDLNAKIIGNNVMLVDSPTLPMSPVKPRKGLLLLAGAMMGMMVGVLGAFIKHQLDNTVKSTVEVEKALRLPSLGMVPDIKKVRKRIKMLRDVKNYDLVVHEAPRSPVAEGIRHIKTSILLSAPANAINTLAVSSAGPGEGKTFVSISLATVLSDGNKKVLLVDADLRRPRVAEAFGGKSSVSGLTTVLTGDDVKLPKVVRRTRIQGLYYVAAGPVPPNPVGLLESNRMAQIMSRFRKAFDFVVIDTPPIIGFSDTRILASRSDGLVLVAKKGHVTMEALRAAANLILTAQGNILGLVLNMVEEGPSYYGGYKHYKMYSRYYGSKS